MTSGDYHVDPDVLTSTADGVRRTAAEQGITDLRRLCGDVRRYGSADAHSALEDFCEQWSNGLSVLTKDAQAIADTLIAAASMYRLAEERSHHSLAGIADEPQ